MCVWAGRVRFCVRFVQAPSLGKGRSGFVATQHWIFVEQRAPRRASHFGGTRDRARIAVAPRAHEYACEESVGGAALLHA